MFSLLTKLHKYYKKIVIDVIFLDIQYVFLFSQNRHYYALYLYYSQIYSTTTVCAHYSCISLKMSVVKNKNQ